jgi:hypothetical protein
MIVRVAVLAAAIVSYAGAAVPVPETHFGHQIGADRTALDWDKVVSYFRALDAASDRVRVDEIGKTTEGRPFIAAFISEASNLRRLDRYREIQRRLADPRITPEPEAGKLIAEGKSIVLITCSIHSTEVASTHTAVEFAHRLLTEDRPRFRDILRNTILILVPSLNPDGVDKVTRWYRKTLNTPYEGTSPPELYHKYVGHDNNRDWYIFSQMETQHTISKLHNVWHPQIVYDVHQQGQNASRIFVPPWMDPIEPNVDAILAQQANMIGTAMAADLTAAGKTGVSIHSSYDFWTPARHYQAYHGGMRILTESASARLSSPVTVEREKLEQNAPGYSAQQRSWNHLEPWPGGIWRLRDIIDYQLIAFESCLYHAAIKREDLLRNFYRVAQRAVARTSPWAFMIPAQQRDPGAARKLMEVLQFGMVEIDRDSKGNHVIRMQQPYSSWAKTLLERQDYPDLRMYPGGPPKRPYDVTAHTIPLLMGVDVQTVEAPIQAKLERVTFPWQAPHAKSFSGSDTDAWKTVNDIWSTGGKVWRDLVSGDFAPSAKPGFAELPRPRLALHRGHSPSMDEGWTRWALEQFGFSYTSLYDKEIAQAGLRTKYDVIVFPDENPGVIYTGYRDGAMPEEFTGGVGPQGEKALKEFAAAGGTIVFLNRSTNFAIYHLGVKARNVVEGISDREFYSPGSLLRVALQPNPLTLGLPEQIAIWNERSPAWETEESAIARYQDSNLLLSGWLLGEKHLANRAALVEARMGDGRVILFGMRPQYRGQSYQAFKLLFNAICHPASLHY